MKKEKPAAGVMLTRDFSEAKFYRVACDCGTPDHDIDYVVEFDEDFKQIVVYTYTTQHTNYWYEKIDSYSVYSKLPECIQEPVYTACRFINSLYRKVVLTWNLWTKGSIEYQSTTIMKPEVAVNYANSILDAIEEINKNREMKKNDPS